MKSNCSKHKVPDHLKDLKQVATDLSDMPYDKIMEFFGYLETKLNKDADNDYKGGRFLLSNKLKQSVFRVGKVKEVFEEIWKICEPFMK